jgi:hypothetical protein
MAFVIMFIRCTHNASYPTLWHLVTTSAVKWLASAVVNFLKRIYCAKIAYFSKIGYFLKIAYFSKKPIS